MNLCFKIRKSQTKKRLDAYEELNEAIEEFKKDPDEQEEEEEPA